VRPDHLDWASHRGARVLREIHSINADIFALQELNRYDDIAGDLAPEFVVLFAPKMLSPAVSSHGPPDGIALCVRRSRLDVLDVEIRYIRSRSTRCLSNQVAIIATLADKATGRTMVIAAAHLKAGSGAEADAIRAEQASVVVNSARSAVSCAADRSHPIPIVLMGDLNAEPGSPAHHDITKTLGPKGGVSAYASCSPDGSEPLMTTRKWTGEDAPVLTHRTVDYIFFTPDSGLTVTALRRLPSAESIGDAGLPSEECPSDHVPLAARFTWVA
jgi:endonuclease/exonuclease/phosphatase family metal-dependent hydrolase